MTAPSANPVGWSKLVVAGTISPGLCFLSGHEREIGWDIQGAKGQDGATSSRKGEALGDFQARFQLSDEVGPDGRTDFDDWPAFQVLLESSITGEEPVALEVVHPDLQRNHFYAVVLRKLGTMDPDGFGGASITVGLGEYRPPKPKPATAATRTGGTGAFGGAEGSAGTETEAERMVREAEEELDGVIEEGEEL